MGSFLGSGLATVIGMAMVGVGLVPAAAVAEPEGVFAAAAARVDVVHDGRNRLVIVSQGGELLLFDDRKGELVETLVIGGDLAGMDITADGGQLAVANRSVVGDEFRIHFVDLDTMQVDTVAKPEDWMGNGAFAVAFDADDALYVTGRFAGSGWRTLYRLSAGAEAFEAIAEVTQETMLRASGDRQVIAFAESDISDGRWGVYFPWTGEIVRRQWYENGTSWFNYEIATNHDGTQFAIPTYGGVHIYDADYQRIAVLGEYAGPAPVGVVYHPVEPLVYFPWAQTQEIRVFDTESLQEVDRINVGSTFEHPGNWAFNNGRLRMSDDGSLLMATVAGGVRIVPLYAPLVASDVTAVTAIDTPVEVALSGSIGNSGHLEYRISRAPEVGEAWVDGGVVLYQPQAGFSGEVHFEYAVSYGLATREAGVTIQVLGPPTAQDDRYVTASATSLRMDVLANDSAGPGGELDIVSFTQPAFGSVSLEGNALVYVSGRGGPRNVQFTYTIEDAAGMSDQANVRILRVRR